MKEDENKPDASERDHKKLGKELELFTFSDAVGKGLPLWLPKGATIRRELERFIVDEEIKRGYLHVLTPDIAKLDLYKKSGHYPHYKKDMYSPIQVDDEEFMLRPMTCPHHFELYLSKPHSYRDLPMRIAEISKLYRYEQSGELMGLQRVRTFCLSDAHIICASPEQAVDEMGKALDLIEYANGVLGLESGKDYWYRLSLGDRNNTEKYFKDDEGWEKAEELLRKLMKERGVDFTEAKDEAAFYGPKIDIQMKNSNGKEDTAFTVQYDLSSPRKFNLTYIGEDGKEHMCYVVHRSSIGSIERTMAFLIEKYAGAFPLWLSPVQVKVLPIGESHITFALEVDEALKRANVRSEVNVSGESLGKKIHEAKNEKIPYMLVIGDKEVADKKITVEGRDEGKIGELTIEELVSELTTKIKDKK
jgi:threonyl-tRNA synthetase